MKNSKTVTFQQSCVDKKSDGVPNQSSTDSRQDAEKPVPAAEEESVAGSSNNEIATLLNDAERRDDTEAEGGRGTESASDVGGVLEDLKNLSWSSSTRDGRLKKEVQTNICRYEQRIFQQPQLPHSMARTPVAVDRPPQEASTPAPNSPKSAERGFHHHQLLQGGDEALGKDVEFDDVLPPTSLLLSQVSTFSQNDLFHTMQQHYGDTSTNSSPFPTNHPDFLFTTENIEHQVTQASVNEAEIEKQTLTRSAEYSPLETMKNENQGTQQNVSFDLNNLLSEGRVVETPHGPAILIPSQHLGMIDPQRMTATMAGTSEETKIIRKFQRWTEDEDNILKFALSREGQPPHNWKRIAKKYFSNSRTGHQCKSRWTKSLQPGLLRGSWKKHEDQTIMEMRSNGLKWAAIAEMLPGRIGEHVRERYVNFLDPTLHKGPWTAGEDAILFREQRRLGNKWTEIANFLPGRSENAVKNRWHNAKMTQRRRLRRQATEQSRLQQNQRARQHCDYEENGASPALEESDDRPDQEVSTNFIIL